MTMIGLEISTVMGLVDDWMVARSRREHVMMATRLRPFFKVHCERN